VNVEILRQLVAIWWERLRPREFFVKRRQVNAVKTIVAGTVIRMKSSDTYAAGAVLAMITS
jgi:hypothetical protein